MKFGLKTFLIAFALVGVTVGWMSRLWITQPEMFFQLLTIGTTVAPFILAGSTIVWLGLRGGPPSRWIAAWGGLLLLMPLLGVLAHRVLLPSGQPIRVLGSERLVSTRLPQDLESPWIWNELEYRLSRGQLNKPLAEAAVRTLTNHMKQTSPTGWNLPLSWQREFLAGARQQGLLSDEVLVDLSKAFYGPVPIVQPVPDLPPGDQYVPLQVHYGNPWHDNSGLGVRLLWYVHSASLDGETVTLQDSQQHVGRDWTGHFRATLAPGQHEIGVEVESALVDENKVTGTNTSDLTPDQWPDALKRWKTRLSVPLNVPPEDNP